MSIVTFKPGDIVFSHGDVSEYAYIVQRGRVEVVRAAQGGGDVQDHVGIIGPGSLFGEIGLLQHAPRMETARALEECELELISRDHFASLYTNSAPEIQKLINALNSKVLDLKRSPVAMQPTEQDMTQSIAKLADTVERVVGLLDMRCARLEEQLKKGLGIADEGVGDDAMAGRSMTQQGISRQLQDLGPIQPMIDDETVNDVLVNGANKVYVERHGKLEQTDITFTDNEEVLKVAEGIVHQVNRKLDPRRPLVDARLLDGSRVNVIAPPLAVDGPSISIRKFSQKKLSLDSMAQQANMSQSLCEFLKILAKCRVTILISGGTGSGKTTLLNAISQHVSHEERIVTIEDAAELQLQQPHVVRLETKPLSTRGRPEDEVSMRDLVKNALRMRPDRIIVGEVRGQEAFDMMQAMNTGHEGSMSTIHANHPRDALARLENMITMANLNIPSKSIKEQIASALHVIVQVSRMRDGHRRVMFLSEVVGIEGDTITLQDVFKFEVKGESKEGALHGEFKWTGIMPRFLRRIAYYGEYEHLADALGVKLPKLQ